MSAFDDLLSFLTGPDDDGPFAVGTVTVVAAGGADDGNDLVTVSWRGTSTYASYGAHYTPVVGHVVFMARTKPLHIIDRIIGTPPS